MDNAVHEPKNCRSGKSIDNSAPEPQICPYGKPNADAARMDTLMITLMSVIVVFTFAITL